MKNKNFYLILAAFILFSLIFPKIASAQLGTGIFDYFDSALEGIEDIVNPLFVFFFKVFLFYIFGLLLLYASTGILEMVMNPQWLTIQNSPLVQYGWHFVVNIASMFLVLFLIVIAFTIILKIETFQAKKTLVRLILVALLMNFTLVFIGASIDISNVFYNTFYRGNEGLPSQVIEKLGAGGWQVVVSLMSWFLFLGGMLMVPFIAPFSEFAVYTGFMAVVFIPTLITWVFQIACFFIVSGMFFTYVILFVARVYIIQILAIISPLAFIAYIFPQTKKYASLWFKYFLEWIFLGIFLFFFMALGLTAADALMPSFFTGVAIPLIGWGQLPDYFIYFLFLIIYLGIAAGVSKKLAPTFTNQVIGMATAGGGLLVAKGLKPLSGIMKKKAITSPGTEKMGQRISGAGLSTSEAKQQFQEKKGLGKVGVMGKWMIGRARPLGRKLESASQEAQRKELETGIKKFEGTSLAKKKDGINSKDPMTQIKALTATAKDEQTKYLEKIGVTDEQKREIVEKALETSPQNFSDLRDAFPLETGQIVNDQNDKIKKLVDEGKTGKARDLQRVFEGQREKAGITFTDKDREKYDSLADKIAAEIKPNKIPRWDKKTLQHFVSQKTKNAPIYKHWTTTHWKNATEEHRAEFTEESSREVDRRTAKYFESENPRLDNWFKKPGGAAVFGLGYSKGALDEKTKAGEVTEPTKGAQPIQFPPQPKATKIESVLETTLGEDVSKFYREGKEKHQKRKGRKDLPVDDIGNEPPKDTGEYKGGETTQKHSDDFGNEPPKDTGEYKGGRKKK